MEGKGRWDRLAHGKMTESVIRLMHGAPVRARVSRYKYNAGDQIECSGRPGTVYVMSGSFSFVSERGAMRLEQEDVFKSPGGKYLLHIDEAAPAVVVWAWEYPSGFTPASS